MARNIRMRHWIIFELASWSLACSVTGHPRTAQAEVTTSAGLGMFVLSDGNYTPLAEVTLGIQRWRLTTNISGYSESQTKVTHILTGLMRQTALGSGGRLMVEYGLGAVIAQTNLDNENERMVNYTAPLGICWSVINSESVQLEANWRSWIFASSPNIPPFVLLSHDRITTLALTLGLAI